MDVLGAADPPEVGPKVSLQPRSRCPAGCAVAGRVVAGFRCAIGFIGILGFCVMESERNLEYGMI